MNKKIAIVTLVAAILGCCLEFSIYLPHMIQENTVFRIFYMLVNAISFPNPFSHFSFGHGYGTLNFLNLFMSSLFLIGAILFIQSGYEEKRLVRFFYAIVLLVHCAAVLTICYQLVAYSQYYKAYKWSILVSVLAIAANIGWSWFSYWVLSRLKEEKPLQMEPSEYEGVYSLINASRWQRFWHLVIDTIVAVMIILPLLGTFGRISYFSLNASPLSLQYILLLAVVRFIYYPFYEGILGATPAKLLSETRVTDVNGNRVAFTRVLGRTLSRMMPFEQLSFFGNGWHDSWTQTYVLKEQRTGVKGNRYLLLLPFYALLAYGIYWGKEEYDKYERYLYSKHSYEQKVKAFNYILPHLSYGHFLKMTEIKDGYRSASHWWKVQAVQKDSVVLTITSLDQSARPALLSFDADNDSVKTVTVSRAALSNAYAKEYKIHEKAMACGVDLLKEGQKQELEAIVYGLGPDLEARHTGSLGGGSIRLDIENKGEAGTVIAIENNTGGIEWDITTFPKVVGTEYYNYLSLQGKHFEEGKPYQFTLVVQDSNDPDLRHKFRVDGTDLAPDIIRLYE